MHIQHLTLATGRTRRIEAGEVPGETLARVRPWLAALVATGQALPVPRSDLADFVGLASVVDGALVVTISGAEIAGRGRPPLVSLGVARRSRHGAELWPLMTGPVMPPASVRAQRPAEPWCAVALWPTLAYAPDAVHWLGDLERCIAWAWCTSHQADDAEADPDQAAPGA